ncbi:zinc finger CCCH domain-containing protein 22 [Dorcoceras hygrometricum]|uniref:Zinc finger CCCH domain-containing protein 22 n=1 Tax=Dorcoceras hygrometricum TaxID=472368 RepID=A0A2Z7BGC4_9LAMI|nr:zinc finger CCCH domain-containing protein 22 [Dorcoceras hygrometricum]
MLELHYIIPDFETFISFNSTSGNSFISTSGISSFLRLEFLSILRLEIPSFLRLEFLPFCVWNFFQFYVWKFLHFYVWKFCVCFDSRVLVKPYKEKGKILDKKLQHEHIEGLDYSVCLSPSVIDSREQLDIPFRSRMLFGAQELMLRRKLEQEAELQHVIEFQGRRLMNLGLMDLKNQSLSHPFPPRMPSSYPHFSRRQFQLSTNQILSSYNINSDVSKG